jgi:hypothetical protein
MRHVSHSSLSVRIGWSGTFEVGHCECILHDWTCAIS